LIDYFVAAGGTATVLWTPVSIVPTFATRATCWSRRRPWRCGRHGTGHIETGWTDLSWDWWSRY